METTLVEARLLSKHLDDPDWVIVDCRFSLEDTEGGRRQYTADHIPGAVYAHLDEDLSGSIVPRETSRHPLPEIERIVEKLSTWGIGDGVQVAAYDESGGAIAARLWWMLHWLGHEGVAVLDGGWTEWKRLGLPVSSEASRPPRKEFQANIQPHMLLSTADIMAMRKDGGMLLVDVRDPERYRGEVEPIDTVAGHIPGASNLPYKENLNAEGSFLSPEVLRAKYKSMLDGRPAGRTVFYCGSGVTAAHSLLAMEHAGLGQGRLYADSWSGWIIDTSREIETGEGIK